MAMTYSSLIAAKDNAGSIANWVNYSKLDLEAIVDEAQALIYSMLRVREMKADYKFTLLSGLSNIALPTGFLDPIGRIYLPSINNRVSHKDSAFLQANRTYTNSSGTLGTDPFTVVSGSTIVTVNDAGHGFNQDAIFYTSGATAVGGVTIEGTFPVSSVVDANNFKIDITALGQTPTSSANGGGTAVSFTCDNLIGGMPQYFGIWNETIYFDQSINQQTSGILQYYKSLPLLSSSNQSNFLTNRYPQLMRRACVAMAADFMKDSEEYQKDVTALSALIQQINVENDGYMRGMELDPEIP